MHGVPAGLANSGVSTVNSVQHAVQSPHSRSGRIGPSSTLSTSAWGCIRVRASVGGGVSRRSTVQFPSESTVKTIGLPRDIGSHPADNAARTPRVIVASSI